MKKLLFLGMAILFPALIFFIAGCQRNHEYEVIKTPYDVIDNLGNKRQYRVFVPKYRHGKKLPVLVYLHGVISDCFKKKYPDLKDYTGSPIEETGLIDFCKTKQIILLVPKAKYEFNFLNCTCKGWGPHAKELDGIEKIIDIVVKKFPVDKHKIFLSGISAGAVVTFHLANRRPEFYNAILSHSQGSMYENLRYLMPSREGPKFGVLLAYTIGDYNNLIKICIETEKIYKRAGYEVVLLKDLPPKSHKWSNTTNETFWKYLNQLGQYQ